MTSAFYAFLFLIGLCLGTLLLQLVSIAYPIIATRPSKHRLADRGLFIAVVIALTYALLFIVILIAHPILEYHSQIRSKVVVTDYTIWLFFLQSPVAVVISILVTHVIRSKWKRVPEG
jgi:hypothetical protein